MCVCMCGCGGGWGLDGGLRGTNRGFFSAKCEGMSIQWSLGGGGAKARCLLQISGKHGKVYFYSRVYFVSVDYCLSHSPQWKVKPKMCIWKSTKQTKNTQWSSIVYIKQGSKKQKRLPTSKETENRSDEGVESLIGKQRWAVGSNGGAK